MNSDIWLYDVTRGGTRLTFHASDNSDPVWAPDGKSVAFSSDRDGSIGLYRRELTGSQDSLLHAGGSPFPCGWSSDGRFLMYSEGLTSRDMWLLPMQGERKPTLFLQTPFTESQGQISPDNRWAAYSSSESGTFELYVRPFPSGSEKWKITTGGGVLARWRHDGKELFYLSGDAKVMAVTVKSGTGAQPAFETDPPVELFDSHVPPMTAFNLFRYAVADNGKRFLMLRGSGESNIQLRLRVMVNWQAEKK